MALTKKVKKKWHPVSAPALLKGGVIGELYVADPETLVGRHVTLNVMNVTGDPRKQNLKARMIIHKVEGGVAKTVLTGLEMVPSSLKRYVRRKRDKVDDSFIVKTKEGLHVRVKPLIITASNTSNAVLTKLRLTARKLVADAFSKNTYTGVLEQVLKGELQKKVKPILSKITLVRNFEVRVLRLLNQEPESLSLIESQSPAFPDKGAASPEAVEKEEKQGSEEKEASQEEEAVKEKPEKKEEVKEEGEGKTGDSERNAGAAKAKKQEKDSENASKDG